jgi:2-polyprenyl-6-methoxyphenol hydroxylase-like FAD-dependent oxidoreductase
VLIIGGGVAGLATSLSLKRVGIPSTLYERSLERGRDGLGFILQPSGLEILDILGLGAEARTAGCILDRFILQHEDGSVILDQQLPESLGLRRGDLLALLLAAVPRDSVWMGKRFTHFRWDAGGHATHACFENGEELEADLFIAADGEGSCSRAELFPEHWVSRGRVKELVSIVQSPRLAGGFGRCFLKVQAARGGLAAGVVPCSAGTLIWYMQFDSERWAVEGKSAPEKRAFAWSLLGEWPHPFPELLRITDFSTSYLWDTTDMELLPSFYRKNVVLLGDAAHALLPFTSQGVSSALQDALSLALYLAGNRRGGGTLDQALQRFSEERRAAVARFLEAGRSLARRFLDPQSFQELAVPLAT